MNLPAHVEEIVGELAEMPGAVAVVLGGSRASGAYDAGSDWDLSVYYRGALDTSLLARRGEVHSPGSWGRLMNGGAWLSSAGEKVDVLLRDLDAVELWSARAREGVYEVDALLGYLAGVPTYLVLAERASGLMLRGSLSAAPPFPDRLRDVGTGRWRFSSQFSLDYARMHARRGDRVSAMAQAAKAAVEEAHARLCARREWVCNEKRIFERAGLHDVQRLFAPDALSEPLPAWVDAVARVLGG
ncbi:MAG TPA: nucleotidyltransferase domain-containing protein [Polyangiaceae bacterium]